MPAKIEPNSKLSFGWNFGERGWNAAMDENLLRIGRFGFQLSVKSRQVSAPPPSIESGDIYIIGPSATGAWAGYEGRLVVWDGSLWHIEIPRVGYVAYVEDEEVLTAYKVAGWSSGIAI